MGRKGPSGQLKLHGGAEDLEAEGPVRKGSQTGLLSPGNAKGGRCCSRGRLVARLRPWALGGSGPPATLHSTWRCGPLPHGPASSPTAVLATPGQSSAAKAPRPEVALTRSLRLAVWSCTRDGDAGSLPGLGPSRAGGHRAAEKEKPNALLASPTRGHEAWFLRGMVPAPPLPCPAAEGAVPGPRARRCVFAARPLPPSCPRPQPRPRTYPGGCGRALRPAAPAHRTSAALPQRRQRRQRERRPWAPAVR